MHERSLKKQIVALLLLVEDAIVLDFATQYVLVKRLQHTIEQRRGRILLFQFYFLVLPRHHVEYGGGFLRADNVGADRGCFCFFSSKRTGRKREQGEQGGSFHLSLPPGQSWQLPVLQWRLAWKR